MLPHAGVPARGDDLGVPLEVPSVLPGPVLEAVDPCQRRVLVGGHGVHPVLAAASGVPEDRDLGL
eukprot:3047138-Lingulodinium_polyedra.AAC.1